MPTQLLKFCKMHGLGNDFMVIDAIHTPISLDTALIKKLSDRHTGIGFDQLLLLKPSTSADFACQFFNADGSEAEQCGNGVRAAARFFHETGYTQTNQFTIKTKAAVIPVIIHDYSRIEVQLGIPHDFKKIELMIDSISYQMIQISMGNPHVILFVESIDNEKLHSLGKKIATHSHFSHGTNVGFVEILNTHLIRLRTYERGVGETLACGSNACAAVAAGMNEKKLSSPITIELPLGKLEMVWKGDGFPIMMIGPAEKIYQGRML